MYKVLLWGGCFFVIAICIFDLALFVRGGQCRHGVFRYR